jgi:hypothetical protein
MSLFDFLFLNEDSKKIRKLLKERPNSQVQVIGGVCQRSCRI